MSHAFGGKSLQLASVAWLACCPLPFLGVHTINLFWGIYSSRRPHPTNQGTLLECAKAEHMARQDPLLLRGQRMSTLTHRYPDSLGSCPPRPMTQVSFWTCELWHPFADRGGSLQRKMRCWSQRQKRLGQKNQQDLPDVLHSTLDSDQHCWDLPRRVSTRVFS